MERKDKMDLMWGLEQLEKHLAKHYSPLFKKVERIEFEEEEEETDYGKQQRDDAWDEEQQAEEELYED